MKSSDHSLIYATTVSNDIAGLIEFECVAQDLYNFMYLIEGYEYFTQGV